MAFNKQIDPNLKPEELARQAYAKAIKLLGAREHSSFELSNKLNRSGYDPDTTAATLQKLVDAGYQSDERFACLYAEQLYRKCYGPLVMKSKLAQRGVQSGLINDAISSLNADWAQHAADALSAKFSLTELSDSDQSQVGKAARYLNRRGFSSTDSIKAIRLAAETVSE